MTLKTFILTLFLVITGLAVFCTTSFAQDKIYKKDGSRIDARITSIGHTMVWYKRPDNLNGPDYGLLKKDIAIVIYPDGNAAVFFGPNKMPDTAFYKNKEEPVKYVKRNRKVINDSLSYHYGKNIFSITPVAFTKALDATINDAGLGLSYERLLDKEGTISFNLPVMLFVSSSRDYNNNVVTNNALGVIPDYSAYNSFWFMPGIKIYTGSDTRKIRFAFGTSLFGVFGSEPYGVYENSSMLNSYYNNSLTSAYHYAMYGFMITGAMNVMAAAHVRLALDIAAGMPVFDDRYLNVYGMPAQVLSPFIQAGFKIGYCK